MAKCFTFGGKEEAARVVGVRVVSKARFHYYEKHIKHVYVIIHVIMVAIIDVYHEIYH